MSKKILTVDDSRTMRAMLMRALASAGFEVFEAGDGLEALEMLTALKFDLIITDLNMPGMDGLQLVRQVRASRHHRNVPVLLLTTEADGDKKTQGRNAGATGWMVKPFQPDSLVSVVNQVVHAGR